MADRFKHCWDLCSMCGAMIRCGTCGYNCCSGGYGALPDGTVCPDCPEAYSLQQAAWADGTAPADHEIHTTHSNQRSPWDWRSPA